MTKPTNNKKRVCIDVNYNLKKEFERLSSVHQQTYDNALEAGMEAAIFLALSPDTIKRMIRKTELELHNLRTQLGQTEDDNSDFKF